MSKKSCPAPKGNAQEQRLRSAIQYDGMQKNLTTLGSWRAVIYSEGLNGGHRGFDSQKNAPTPFGYGLPYTTALT